MTDAGTAGLAELERRLARDMEVLSLPPADWTVPRQAPDGSRALDVAIVGAGMCGLAAAFALKRQGIGHIRLIDRSATGSEGPWVTFARMKTLRSPKQLPGPAQGMAALTFRAWFEARFGAESWEDVGKIPRVMWMDYLRWYRHVLALPVENGVEVRHIGPEPDGLLRLDLERDGTPGRIWARKVVLASGRDGLGGPTIPAFMSEIPRHLHAHTADDIDFAALRGRKVAVIGAGASAMDNAASALEAGIGELHMLVRRPALPRVNKLTGTSSPGFTYGFRDLDDPWRWRIMRYAMAEQVPPPRTSTLRVSGHPNAFLHLSAPVRAARVEDGRVVLTTPRGDLRFDFVILGTGFGTDPARRPELAAFADRILLWRDRFTPPPDEAAPELELSPYLGRAFQFLEKERGSAPWLKDIHCFNFAATLSLGKVSGDIPEVGTGAEWLATGIASQMFVEDRETHYRYLQAFDTPELLGDEWPEERVTR